MRDSIDDEWQVVSWDEAIERVASGFLGLREKYGVGAIGGTGGTGGTLGVTAAGALRAPFSGGLLFFHAGHGGSVPGC